MSSNPINTIPRPALFRIMAMLIIVMTIVVVFEYRQCQRYSSIEGKVLKIANALASSGGDNKAYEIEYFVKGKKYLLVTRRGIVDSIGKYCCLTIGDTVPIAVDREQPSKAILDSFNARYPLTIMFGMLTLVFLTVTGVVVMKARSTRNR